MTAARRTWAWRHSRLGGEGTLREGGREPAGSLSCFLKPDLSLKSCPRPTSSTSEGRPGASAPRTTHAQVGSIDFIKHLHPSQVGQRLFR